MKRCDKRNLDDIYNEIYNELDEFILVIGSLFYSKDMKKVYGNNPDKLRIINCIHACLYNYNMQSLIEMLQNKAIVKLILLFNSTIIGCKNDKEN